MRQVKDIYIKSKYLKEILSQKIFAEHQMCVQIWDCYFVQGFVKSYSRIISCACRLNHFSCVWLFATLWIVAHQAPLFMGFSRQEYWSGLPSPSPGDLPNSGIRPGSPALQLDSLRAEQPGKPHNEIVIWLLILFSDVNQLHIPEINPRDHIIVFFKQ